MKVSKYRNNIFGDFIGCLFSKLTHNGLHMACGGFGVLSCPPKPNLATEQKSCW